MRYFLATYISIENFEISKIFGVFGAPKSKASKIKELQRGDLVIIRDGRRRRPLAFFGYCKVVGDVWDQDKRSPYRDFLWRDEQDRQKILYPLRVAVDFVDVPQIGLGQITWTRLDSLNLRGTRSLHLKGQQALAKKLDGNFIKEASEIEAFSRLVCLPDSKLENCINKLVALATEQGCRLTYNDINRILPPHVTSTDEIDNVLLILNSQKIDVVDQIAEQGNG